MGEENLVTLFKDALKKAGLDFVIMISTETIN